MIVTTGLVAYYNSKQGVDAGAWQNIAPATAGTMNGVITDATVGMNGMYFNGTTSIITVTGSPGLTFDYTMEAWVIPTTDGNSNGAIVAGSSLGGMLQYSALSDKFRSYWNGYRETMLAYAPEQLYHVVFVFSNTEQKVYMYIDGTLESVAIDTQYPTLNENFNSSTWSIGKRVGSGTYNFKGHIAVLRLYNKLLTAEEVAQNFAVSTDVGLDAAPPVLEPVVTSITVDKPKISDEAGKNQAIITVQFDKDVTQYVARLNGTSYDTGILVHTGGAAPANTDCQVIVDWNESLAEGTNKINVYGQNADGWTTQ